MTDELKARIDKTMANLKRNKMEPYFCETSAQARELVKTLINKGDTISKIVPFHTHGNIVTVPRYDINYVVTEYGIADLKYKTERQRAEALIAIAHPNFRDELRFEGRKLGVL